MTALIVCSRFSASSNDDAGDSTLRHLERVEAVLLEHLLPDRRVGVVEGGRQCMNFTSGLPVSAIVSAFTW